ncbi:hypothetical protein WG922_05540 [Ramlibacter sp. AN1015]|uniref:hypothetical protein n=1 Tax=Ramlibacter sp. AN1015 TaxID=3133428 RepID=UPI0030BC945A
MKHRPLNATWPQQNETCRQAHEPAAGSSEQSRPRTGNVLLTTPVPDQKTAWTKARADVRHQVLDSGYEVVPLPWSANPADWVRLFARLRSHLRPGNHLLIEYPVEQRKRLVMLGLLKRLLRVPLYALLHDLNSLRYPDSPARRELAVLRLFDGLISHNPSMTDWLREGGIRSRIVDLQLFDYLAPAHAPWHASELSSPVKIVCAGNLSHDKAGYIYHPQLLELARRGDVELALYGAFFEPERAPSLRPYYHGAFSPDAPRLDAAAHFGLIWDGQGVTECSGMYGQYMRYNNPHKLSLYAALGLPVVVWEQAAIARFVRERRIGVTVAHLGELGDLPQRVTPEAYRQMTRNARALQQQVRNGAFLRDALRRLAND